MSPDKVNDAEVLHNPAVEGVALTCLKLTVGGAVECKIAGKTQILLSRERFLQYPILTVRIQL